MGPRVIVGQGELEGINHDEVHCFLGIPYAAPPVGDFRWHAPQPPVEWQGVRDARHFSSIAVQTVGASFTLRVTEQSEDCLYLNVWTTSCDSEAKQPVMLWIHGGGNLGGAGSEDAYDGASLAKRGVTAVTINYRLGAFGFLAHPDVGANFGVLDYVAALEWVAANIDVFGGDPGNVTIFGQSAGAVAVRTLLSVPRARGLFHRAIMQSAGFEPCSFAPTWSYERARSAADRLFDRLGSRKVDELRQVPTDELRKASHELSGIFPRPGQVHTPANLVWMPVPDGHVVMENGLPGWPDDVPVMLGCVENEARYFIKPAGTYTKEVLENMARALCGPRSEDVVALFEKSEETCYESLDRLFSSVIWFEPALATTEHFAKLGRRFYYYHFARVSPGARQTRDLVKHTAEIRYVFDNLTSDGAYDETDEAISHGVQGAWVEFARTGVPRGPDGPPWPAFDEARVLTWIEDNFATRPFAVSELTQIIHSLRSENQ
jgi:para-nitrobenzyl esterase